MGGNVETRFTVCSRLTILEKITLDSHKTKEAITFIKSMGLPERTLFIISNREENLERAVRNLPRTNVLLVDGLNAFDLLNHKKIVCTPETIKKIEERLNK